MKTKTRQTIEKEAVAINIVAAVNYGEEEIPNDFPGRLGDTWNAVIDIDTGRIYNWPKGRKADMHLTVKDSGCYYLIDALGMVIAAIEQGYVPHSIVPGSYGDTIELQIGPDGVITNWPRNPTDKDFHREDE